jgi:histidinol-phosphate phosphatase family protein
MTGVFLDRDGVIIQKAPEGSYVSTWKEVRFLPGAIHAVSTLYNSGFKILIVTNQRGLALRKIRPENLEDIHMRLRARFARYGVNITQIYFCPHPKSARCSCRKPKPGMLLRAAEENGLNLPDCWLIGDSPSDIQAGKRAGCKTAWLKRSATQQDSVMADVVAPDLPAAVGKILKLARVHLS